MNNLWLHSWLHRKLVRESSEHIYRHTDDGPGEINLEELAWGLLVSGNDCVASCEIMDIYKKEGRIANTLRLRYKSHLFPLTPTGVIQLQEKSIGAFLQSIGCVQRWKIYINQSKLQRDLCLHCAIAVLCAIFIISETCVLPVRISLCGCRWPPSKTGVRMGWGLLPRRRWGLPPGADCPSPGWGRWNRRTFCQSSVERLVADL